MLGDADDGGGCLDRFRVGGNKFRKIGGNEAFYCITIWFYTFKLLTDSYHLQIPEKISLDFLKVLTNYLFLKGEACDEFT